ncbi:MAG: hypothetical protein HYU36_11085 [Planctomycetes bacterium]|nr:hypothetical protein [Planctomycetota bacterium]
MTNVKESCRAWLDRARKKLAQGTFTEKDLEQLEGLLKGLASTRQRLLYLHASEPCLHAPVIGMALHEPEPGATERLGERKKWPYATVHEAILDGWQVIHFPNQLAPFDDREVDILGFEFILQKWRMDDEHTKPSAER